MGACPGGLRRAGRCADARVAVLPFTGFVPLLVCVLAVAAGLERFSPIPDEDKLAELETLRDYLNVSPQLGRSALLGQRLRPAVARRSEGQRQRRRRVLHARAPRRRAAPAHGQHTDTRWPLLPPAGPPTPHRRLWKLWRRRLPPWRRRRTG